LLRVRDIVPAEEVPALFERARGQPRAQAAGERQALVFVHGYNVGFEDALKRIAQIAFDLDFRGACLLFS
jgi:esterase/lipase superfamily enzyme